jgi:hypothetical protein
MTTPTHEIKLPDCSLGKLRYYHDTVQTKVSRGLTTLYNRGQFLRLSSTGSGATIIRGFDDGILGYRCTIPKSHRYLIDRLKLSIVPLVNRYQNQLHPVNGPSRGKPHEGINRGDYVARHYCVWRPYRNTPCLSREFRDDMPLSLNFIDQNSDLWKYMSERLREQFPRTYREFTKHQLPNCLERLAGAWCGMVVNLGNPSTNTGVRTQPHRDVKESIYGYSCLTAFGNFTGGDLILWDAKVVIELKEGDLFFFPDALIHHSNEPVVGERYSIVSFTQENVLQYWRQKFPCPIDTKRLKMQKWKKMATKKGLRKVRVKSIKNQNKG